MKKLIKVVLALCVLVSTVTVMAQKPSATAPLRKAPTQEQVMQKMKSELKLTDKQVVEITKINKKFAKKMKAEGADKLALVKLREAKIMEVMTVEQAKQWTELKKREMINHKHRRGMARPAKAENSEKCKEHDNCCPKSEKK